MTNGVPPFGDIPFQKRFRRCDLDIVYLTEEHVAQDPGSLGFQFRWVSTFVPNSISVSSNESRPRFFISSYVN